MTENQSPEERGGYADVSGGETADVESDAANVDAGGKAHTSSQEGHPAGDGPRSDREVGGPVAEEDAEETTGGTTGDISTKGFDAHS